MKSIRTIRKALGLTQTECAAYLGVSRSLLSMVELNKRELPTKALLKLAELELKRSNPNETKLSEEAYQQAVQELGQRILGLHLKIRRTKKSLKRMKANWEAEKITQSLANVRPFPISEKYQHQRQRINCAPFAQQLLEARIAGLEMELELLQGM